jgi:hypothetical protein
MQTLIALHAQNPSMTWLAVGALFIALSLASGVGRFIHPALGAGAVGGICALGVKLGLAGELLVFICAAAGSVGVDVFNVRRRAKAAHAARAHRVPETPRSAHAPETPETPATIQPPLQFVRTSETAAPPAPAPAPAPGGPDHATTVPPRRAAGL